MRHRSGCPSSGNAEFKINGQDANNYPHLPEVESTATIAVPADLLRDDGRFT